jgi:hypothetical protein
VATSGRAVLGWFAGITALSLPAIVDPGAVAKAAQALDLAGGAVAIGWKAAWVVAVVTSSLVLMLAPGLMLALGLGSASRPTEWLLQALALSTVAVSVVTEAVELGIGGPLRGTTFALTVWGISIAAAIWAGRRARWVPDRSRLTGHTLAAAVAGPLLLFALLIPKFLTETFNGDGAHAYESARLLLHRALPFWSPEAGGMANYPGVTTFLSSYPTAWFVRLLGEIEASARLPYLLFAGAGLYAGVLTVAEAARERGPFDVATRWLLWAGLAVFSLVMGYSATYNPYHADFALPAAADALVIAWFLGVVWATATHRMGWMIGFGVAAYLTSPAGVVLLGLWLVAIALFLRPWPRRELVALLSVLVAGVAIGRGAPIILAALGQPVPGTEHAAGGLMKRLLRIQWRDWTRLAYFIVPAGIVPALALGFFRRFDGLGRAVASVAVAQFVFFYLQARVSLHYFAPAMVLPLATWWPRRVVVAAVVIGAALATAVSWPATLAPHTDARAAGLKIEDRLAGYQTAQSAAFRRSELLGELFHRDSYRAVPDSAYGGSPLSWFYYAHQAKPAAGPVAYLLQAESDSAPAGGRLVAAKRGAALYVVDEAALAADRARRPPITIAPLYRMSKRTPFTG